MSHKGLSLKIFLLIVMNDVFNSFAQLFMKKGLADPTDAFTSSQAFFDFIAINLGSPMMWLGISIYALSFFLWIIVLSRVDLSTAMPIASTDYVFIPILAIVFLHETVSPLRWLGILAIMAGIYCVSKSSHAAIAKGDLP